MTVHSITTRNSYVNTKRKRISYMISKPQHALTTLSQTTTRINYMITSQNTHYQHDLNTIHISYIIYTFTIERERREREREKRERVLLGIQSKHTTVRRFLRGKRAILIHKKTYNYSFATLSCQAEDGVFIWEGDSVAHTTELN